MNISGSIVFVAHDDTGERIGSVTAHRVGSRWRICQLDVKPEHRRRGVGRALIAALPSGVDAVANEESAGFYERCGFVQSSTGLWST